MHSDCIVILTLVPFFSYHPIQIFYSISHKCVLLLLNSLFEQTVSVYYIDIIQHPAQESVSQRVPG